MVAEEARAALHRAVDETLDATLAPLQAELRALRLQLNATHAERDEIRAALSFAEATAGTLRARVEELGNQADVWRDRANQLHGELGDLKEHCSRQERELALRNARLTELGEGTFADS